MGGPYQIPRNVKGEGRILMIFSVKSLIFTTILGLVGIILYKMLSMIGLSNIGIVVLLIFVLIGFAIGTFKIPEVKSKNELAKISGENIDDIILRYLKFKKRKNRIYIYDKEETKDE